ncbi:MAG TPA: glycosyltransferase family 4 protein [Solirubrobacteraceae bacterium]|nr:glycosyltransferase family 4 protein [Solirubrobacteraceae bacterium]
MAGRRILVVTHPYPPMPSVGGNRWLAMAKYLRRRGHEVDILTTSAFGSLPDDKDLGVHRSGDLIAARWLRMLMRRPPLPQGGETASVDKPPHAIVTRFLVPDHYVATWVPFAVRAARHLTRERAYDCVITTSAYESTHLVGLGLGRHRPAWIADFRDGWTFHSWREPFPTALQRRIDVRLERAVVRSADRTIVVERPVGEDFRDRLGIDAGYAPNGWDPDLERDAGEAEPPRLDEAAVTLVHTGKLTGGWGRHPGALLDALRRLREEDPQTAARLRLVLAGRLDEDEQRLIEGARLDGIVRHVGVLTRAQAMALQRDADVLLLITSPTLVWELPGKVFEYFGAGRPILALAHENEAARLVRETGTGWTVPPRDVDAIAAVLRRLAREGADLRIDPKRLESYTYPRPAEVVEAEIERAIEARSSRAR